jgi:hypothetical protein
MSSPSSAPPSCSSPRTSSGRARRKLDDGAGAAFPGNDEDGARHRMAWGLLSGPRCGDEDGQALAAFQGRKTGRPRRAALVQNEPIERAAPRVRRHR